MQEGQAGHADLHEEDGDSLMNLNTWVTTAYMMCGRQEDNSMSLVAMMAAIEQTLAECLKKTTPLAAAVVEDWERAREKERRQVYSKALLGS